MNLTLTPEEAVEKGIWEELCELKGLNPHCVNEGLLDNEEELYLDEEEARTLRLIE